MIKVKYIFVLFMSTLILQGCSWLHILQIKNSTDKIWEVEYEILDKRGIFKNQIYIQNEKEKKGELVEFESNIIKFKVQPKQTVRLGIARNSHYKVYKEFSEFDKEIPWKTFINVHEIRIFNGNESFRIDANKLDKVLSKNSRGFARIDVSKIIELENKVMP